MTPAASPSAYPAGQAHPPHSISMPKKKKNKTGAPAAPVAEEASVPTEETAKEELGHVQGGAQPGGRRWGSQAWSRLTQDLHAAVRSLCSHAVDEGEEERHAR